MTDYTWPDDLPPFVMSFYLQPHTGGSESPFTRQSKVYGLSAPRWVCSMSFRGGYDGTRDQSAFGPRLDALITKLKGRQNRALIYDFRRPRMRSPLWPLAAGNLAASAGDTTMTITGLPPGTLVYVGDYLGGDGRPHIIGDDLFGTIAATADASGHAVVSFEPPLKVDVPLDTATFGSPPGVFRLVDDDAGQNPVSVGELVNMTMNFVEDLTSD